MKFKNLNAGGKIIQYVERGEGTPLLFIHGWGVSPYTYQNSILVLSRHFRVIAPYIINRTNLKTSAKLLADFIDVLEIPRVIIAGHSFSGLIACAFAYYYPQKTRVLILIDSMGIDFGRTKLQWFIAWIRHIISMSFGSNKEPAEFLRRIAFDFGYHVIFHPYIIFKELIFMLKTDISDMVKDIPVPILFLKGTDDALIPQEIGQKFISLNKRVVLKTMSGGHNWSKVDVEALSRAVVEFINTI